MFQADLLLIIRRIDSVQTATGIVNVTHYNTNFCTDRKVPTNDEQQACSKNVEASYCNKLIENSASSWFISYYTDLPIHVNSVHGCFNLR